MITSRSSWFFPALAVATFSCSPSDSGPSGASGGSAGQTAGAGGNAGVSQGGSAGKAGGSQAGAAGNGAGAGGMAGAAGKGGSAGNGGNAGSSAGSGGSAGQAGGGPLAAVPAHVGPNGEVSAAFDGGPADTGAWIGLFAAGAPDTAPTSQQGTMGKPKGSLVFATPADIGAYELRLFSDAAGTKKVATAPFAVEMPYDLDPSFAGGKVTFDFLGKQKADWLCGLRGLAGGGVIVAGTAKTGDKDVSGYENNVFAVARLLPSGALDPSFGNGGKAQLTTTTHGLAGCSAFAVQPDGKVVVGGWGYNTKSTGDFVLGRFTVDGQPDLSFGTGGIVTTDFGQWEELGSVAVLPDGRIIAGGTLEYSMPGVFTSAAFARYLPTGALDPTFGAAGKMTLAQKSWQETARSLVVAADGSFHAGVSDDKSTQTGTVTLVHVSADGTLDAAFGKSGVMVESGPAGTIDRSLVALAQVPKSNALLLLGRLQTTSWFLGRYSPTTGALDTAFGTSGQVTATFGSAGALAAGLMIAPDGNLLIGASPDSFDGVSGIDGNFGLLRHASGGAPDLSFGRLRYKWSAGTPKLAGRVTSVDLQADGKVLLGGFVDRTDGSFDFDFAIMRLVKSAGW